MHAICHKAIKHAQPNIGNDKTIQFSMQIFNNIGKDIKPGLAEIPHSSYYFEICWWLLTT